CKICGKKGEVELPRNDTKKIGNKEKNDREKVLFSTNHAKKDITSKTQNMIAKGRATQLQKGIPSEHTIENKVISTEKAILEELRNESILTSNEFIEKMAVVEAREEAERFEKLLCSIAEPFINKISKLKNAGLLNEQEYEQKKRKIIEKHRAELLDEQERKQKKCAMIKKLLSISEDDYLVMNAQAFDYLDIIDKKKKLGLIKTQDEEMNETFRLQEIHQELVECNEICFKCDAFRKPSDEKCSACGQIFNKE
ncbi:SHOCT domain-containing protein, partial [Candidatus Parcubacteria bacterium]|nr:SHOCT domain-containing protein [Candidatus Parcubacteria bacterium]